MAQWARIARTWKFLLGVFVHILYLPAVVDVYFKSPLVQDLSPLPVATRAPADRLVLFIADGLRADKFFQTSKEFPKSRAPFLRSVIESKGSFGVSHSKAPTETRPGHVAVIAGFFEDVSAVTKSWKENPVDFDSVFNESRWTYCWGSCFIIPVFSSRAVKNNVIGKCYEEYMIDFADRDRARADEWVFGEVEEFFKTVRTNSTLHSKLKSDKLVFFLHLLGFDGYGHIYTPNSKEYLGNIKSVDSGIHRMVNVFESFYENDGKTAYILTADHGMSELGSHGNGHPDVILTPIVAWGAGVQGPVMAATGNDVANDYLSREWELDRLKRLDVSQIDIPALMSTLVGIPFPVNSMGVLPVDYLNGTDRFKAESLFLNAKQILAQYKKKESTIKATSIVFRPYMLAGSRQEEYIRTISSMIREGRYNEAMKNSRSLIQLSINGLRYYHSHNTTYIVLCLTFGLSGWIILVIMEVFQSYSALDVSSNPLAHSARPVSHKKLLLQCFGGAALIVAVALMTTSASFVEYLYCFMPLLVSYELAADSAILKKLVRSTMTFPMFKVIGFIAVYILLLTCLVASFAQRKVLSLLLTGIAVFPILVKRKVTILTISWMFSASVLSVFPQLPTIKREENYRLVAIAGLLAGITSFIYSCLPKSRRRNSFVVAALAGAVILCTFIRIHATHSINARAGLPLTDQVVSWLLVPSLPSFALLTGKTSISRLVSVVTSLVSIYLLMCISHEGLFVFVFSLSMFLWIKVEQELLDDSSTYKDKFDRPRSSDSTYLSASHSRIAYTFLFFIFLAFFGTGNIASLNSLHHAPVNCFITTSRTFNMKFLWFLKISIPAIIVCCTFGAMRNSLGIEIRGLVYVVLVMTDLMSIVLFFLIKDEGSWREIGTSIAHFVIMLVFGIVLLPLFELMCLLTGAVTLERK